MERNNKDRIPEDEKKELEQIRRYQTIIDSIRYSPAPDWDYLNRVAEKFSESCLLLTKKIEGNLIKESLRI